MDKGIFAERFVQALKDKGMSAAELSKLTGVSEGVISQYKSGKYEPKRERVEMFSRLLGVSPAWLIGYDTDDELEKKSVDNYETGRRLAYARECNNMTIDEAAQRIDVHRNALLRWENGDDTTPMDVSTLGKISKLYSVNAAYLMNWSNDPSLNANSLYHNFEAYGDKPRHLFAIVKTVKKCVDWFMYDNLCGYLSADVEEPEQYFYFYSQGNDMAPAIPDGTIAFIHKQDHVHHGELALVVIDEECYIRKVLHKGTTNILQPFNLTENDSLIIEQDSSTDFKIVGKVMHTLTKTTW